MVKLSIIIPARNEEKRVTGTLDIYYEFFKKKVKSFEMVIIPNNCTDGTYDIIKKFAKSKKNIKIKNIPYYCGKGGAVLEGFKLAEGEYVGFVDADNSTKPEAFYDLYLKINGNDGIIASRWIKGAKISPKQPLIRRVASRCFNILVRRLFKINLRDTQCGAKLFKRKAVDIIIKNGLSTTKWAFDIDLLYMLKRNGLKVIEIPTTWSDSLGSKLDVKKTSMEMFLAIGRLRLIYSPFRFIVKLYDKIMK